MQASATHRGTEQTLAIGRASRGTSETRAAARLIAGLSLGLVATWAAAVSAQTVTKTPMKWPIGGLVSLSGSAGIGTFVAGEQNRPSVSSSLNLLVNFQPMPGLTLMVSQTINKTFADFAEDPFAPRLRNTSIDDILLVASWSPMVSDDAPRKEMSDAEKKALAAAAATNPTLVTAVGAGKPLTLPGGVRLSFLGLAQLPTGKSSQFQGRYIALTGAANFSRAFGPVSLTYQPRFQKQFHKYTSAVIENDGAVPFALGRDGGAESISDNLVATNQQNVSWAVRNALICNIAASENLSFQVFYFLLHQFRYYDAPLDELSSQFARGGTRMFDLQFGSITANYVLPANWFASLSVATFSMPWSADNSTLRFPFFDFRSTSDNITSLNIGLTRSF